MLTNLDRTTTTVLHQIADVSWFNASSNKRSYVVMIQFCQLHKCKLVVYVNVCYPFVRHIQDNQITTMKSNNTYIRKLLKTWLLMANESFVSLDF